MIRILGEKFMQRNCSKQIITHISRLSSDQKAKVIKKKEEEQSIKWRKMYYLDGMIYLSILTRMKIYPALATAFFVPISIFIEAQNIYEGVSFLQSLLIGTTGTSIFCGYSALLRNTIGIVYSCPENKKIRIAYIDFLGRQQIIETTVNQLKQCEKSKPKMFGLYKLVKVMDNGKEIMLKLPNKHGEIFDITLYKKVFGKKLK